MDALPPILFNRARLRKRHARAAATKAQHDFLWREAAARAEETLSCITRAFPRIAVFGDEHFHAPEGTSFLLRADHALQLDEEYLPFAENAFDAIFCLLTLHWVNDLPGTLAQIFRALKPDGLFFAILPGGETLRELRSIFAATELAQSSGIHARIAPFIDVRDAGALLQRAGFAMPVADSELLTVSYDSLFDLMHDLRGSGQVNMLQQQVKNFTPRRFFVQAASDYAAQHKNAEGRIDATVEFITMTGWKPAPRTKS